MDRRVAFIPDGLSRSRAMSKAKRPSGRVRKQLRGLAQHFGVALEDVRTVYQLATEHEEALDPKGLPNLTWEQRCIAITVLQLTQVGIAQALARLQGFPNHKIMDVLHPAFLRVVASRDWSPQHFQEEFEVEVRKLALPLPN